MCKNSLKRLPFAVLSVAVTASLLTSCGFMNKGETIDEPVTQAPQVSQKTVGDVLASSGLKIKASLLTTAGEKAMAELYVDTQGDGYGLFGIGETVLPMYTYGNKVYVHISNDIYVELLGVSSRMYHSGVETRGYDELQLLGFQISDGQITGYSNTIDGLNIQSSIGGHSSDIKETPIVPRYSLSLDDLCRYVADFNTESSEQESKTDEGVEVEQESSKPSFGAEETVYLDSVQGITIEGQKYSVGDRLNPDDYFGSLRPEGILESSEYKEDTRIDFTHFSYLSSTGKTTFTTRGGYVQGICTTADFNFLGIEKCVTVKELYSMLGWKLSKTEAETFVPLADGLSVKSVSNGKVVCSWGDIEIEFRAKNGSLSEIYIYKPYEFTT